MPQQLQSSACKAKSIFNKWFASLSHSPLSPPLEFSLSLFHPSSSLFYLSFNHLSLVEGQPETSTNGSTLHLSLYFFLVFSSIKSISLSPRISRSILLNVVYLSSSLSSLSFSLSLSLSPSLSLSLSASFSRCLFPSFSLYYSSLFISC